MAVLYVPHFIQFLDDNGNPLSGGKLYTYSAGTTTPKATYTTEAATVQNANPVVLDSSGRAVVFLTGSYKFRLEDSLGNLIRETDNVTAFSVQSSTVDDIIANFTEDVITASDSIIFADASDSNSTKRDTVQGILDLVTPYTPSKFTSSAQTITAAGALTLAHSLGSNPTEFGSYLTCTSADAGYSSGARIAYFPQAQGNVAATSNSGVTINSDATNLNIRFGQSASTSTIFINHATTGVLTGIDNTKWTITFWAKP